MRRRICTDARETAQRGNKRVSREEAILTKRYQTMMAIVGESVRAVLFFVGMALSVILILGFGSPSARPSLAAFVLLLALSSDALSLYREIRETGEPLPVFPLLGYFAAAKSSPFTWPWKIGAMLFFLLLHVFAMYVANQIYGTYFNGRGALHRAVLRNDIASVRACLAAGADPNAQDGAGITPVYLAVDRNRKEALHLLMEAGGDMDVPNRHGVTPTGIIEYRQAHKT